MKSSFFSSSIGLKIIMAVSGVLLGLFLVAHVIGNLEIFFGADSINHYGELLRTLPPLLWAMGSERKTTGSFFTAEDLIKVLLDSALDPVIESSHSTCGRLARRSNTGNSQPESLRPRLRSGHFLVAAAHRLARVLAQLQTGEGEPAPETMRSALRAVISNCIYGVDINPMSVELCKVSLWMEALEPGKPLSFLDAHIQCGDSLVGVSPSLDISEIPDEALNPALGDDKVTSTALGGLH